MNLYEVLQMADENGDWDLIEKIRSMIPEGGHDLKRLKLVTRFKLEKFDGDYEPGKQPYEVVEGGDDIPTTVRAPV